MSYPESNNKINLKTWEFVLMLVCVIAGLFIAYFFGYKSGHSVGYDDAQAKALKNTPRFEIFEGEPQKLDKEALDKVYAKLEGAAVSNQDEAPEGDSPPTKKPADNIDEIDLSEFKVEPEEKKNLLVKEEIQIARLEKAAEDSQAEVLEVVVEEKDSPVSEIVSVEMPTEIPVEPEDLGEIEKEPEIKVETEKKTIEMEPAADPVEAKEEQAAVEIVDKPEGGWYVQVATSKSPSDAKKIVNQLYQSGFKSQIEEFTISRTKFYRILVGPENRKSYAERLVNQLGREQFLSGKPFIRQIK